MVFMMKAIEILFRIRLRLLALLFLPILVGTAIVMTLPRQYRASAALWALHRYEILGATGPESDLNSSPGTTQATALTELLQARSFALAVAYDTDLPQQIASSSADTQSLQDALYAEVSGHVVVTAVGYNLFDITYANTNPQIAEQVVQQVVSHYGIESASQSTAEGEQLLISYQAQLNDAQKLAGSATKTATAYLQDHQLTPVTAQVDPEYQLLSAQADQARAALANVQTNINTINQELATLSTGSAGLYTTLDPPTVPIRPESRTKTFLLGGGIGLALGLLVGITYLLILMRLDQSVYSPVDMPVITSYPVLIQVPRFPHQRVALGNLVQGEGTLAWNP
jgi:uncharacterized protein involved in exopolysaccharide biosynthesis